MARLVRGGGHGDRVVLAILNQWQTKKPQAEAARLAAEADARTEAARKAIETVRGLGMTRP